MFDAIKIVVDSLRETDYNIYNNHTRPVCGLRTGGVTMLSMTEIEQTIQELLRRYHAEGALLFGSYARGDATENSDIDVAIIGGAYFRKTDIFAFAEELRSRTGKEVDAFEMCEINVGTPFYDAVMKEGKRIA